MEIGSRLRIVLLISLLLTLTACGSSPERRALEKRAFLEQHKAFAPSTARTSPRVRALAKSGGECDEQLEPLIAQAKAAVGELDDAVKGANQTLDASTGGNAAVIAALLAAAAAQQNGSSPGAANTPAVTPPRVIGPVVAGPPADAPMPQLGTGGFGSGAQTPAPGGAGGGSGGAPGAAGVGPGGDNTIAQVGGGSGGHDQITGGTRGGGAGGADTIVGGTTGGGGRDTIVGGVQGARPESVGGGIGSLEAEAGGGGGGAYFAGAGRDELLPASALAGRAPASVRVAGLGSAADVATQYGPGIFSLTTQTYSRYCVRQNLGACPGLGR